MRLIYRRKCYLPLVVVAASAVSMFEASPQTDPTFAVRATGYGGGTDFAARNAAIEDALRQALREVLFERLPETVWPQLDPLIAQATKYVERYDVLRYDTSEGETKIELDAFVSDAMLNRDLARIMLPLLPVPPSVVLLVGEQLPEDAEMRVSASGTAEAVLREGIADAGIVPMDVGKLSKLYGEQEMMDIALGDAARGALFAKENLAHAAVVGTAMATAVRDAPDSELRRTRATVALRVFRGYDGKIVNSHTATAIVFGADPQVAATEAIRDAASKIVQDVIDSIVIASLGAQSDERVLLVIQQPESHETVLAVQSLLQRAPGVFSAKEIFYSDALARLEIAYEGPMSVLADMLLPEESGIPQLTLKSVVGREILLVPTRTP